MQAALTSMDDQTRREAAGATLGMAGVGTAAALRHTGLERAYKKGKRPPILQELKMLREGTKGRRFYVAGMALGAVSTPGAAHSINELATANKMPVTRSRVKKSVKQEKRRGFAREGAHSVKESFLASGQTIKHPPPAKLAVGNYLGGAAIGTTTGGVVHHVLGKTKFPGTARSAAAMMTATGVGALTLPLQSRIMNRATKGAYETTATGVRRVKTKPKRPSSVSTQVEARSSRGADPRRARQEIVGKAYIQRSLRKVPRARLIESHKAAMWEEQTRGQAPLAQAHQQFIRELKALPAKQTSNARFLARRTAGVAKYYGEDMSHAQKRRRVATVTGLPFVADAAQAGQAARMAPPELRRKTAALTYGGGQLGGVSGSVAGAYGAAALARRSKRFTAGTAKVDDAVSAGKAKARSVVHLPPKGDGPSIGARALGKAPSPLRRAAAKVARPLAGHGKAAAVGSLVLGALGGQAGSQTGYGAALKMEDRLRAKRSTSNQGARHGTRVAKAEPAKVMTPRERVKLRRQKEQSAALSMAGGVTGLGALGASVGSKVPHVSPKIRGRLGKVPVPLLTAGAGLGGINAFKYADIQHKEAKFKKGYLSSTGRLVRRAPSMRSGFVRQTRTRTGIKTSTVRGSLG